MALGKTVAEILTNKTAAASNSTTLTDCTTIDTEAVLMLGIECKVTYHGSATLGVTVGVYDSSDNVTFDTNPSDQWDMPFTAGASISKTVATLPAGRYKKVKVTNNDTGQSATAIYVYSHPLTG